MFRAKILRRLGEAVDRYYLRRAGAGPIPGSQLGLLLICYHPFHGSRAVTLSNGVVIHPGDPVVEFHLANQEVVALGNRSGQGLQWQLLESLRGELTKLAEACRMGVVPPKVQGFYGINVMPAAARRLGFTLIPLPPGWERWWLGFWESLLRVVFYSFPAAKAPRLARTMDPQQIWLTRAELVRRYSQAAH